MVEPEGPQMAIWRPVECWVSKGTRTHALANTNTQRNGQDLLLFHGYNSFVNAPQCYVIRTLWNTNTYSAEPIPHPHNLLGLTYTVILSYHLLLVLSSGQILTSAQNEDRVRTYPVSRTAFISRQNEPVRLLTLPM